MEKVFHIAVAGNIGAGKTTLTTSLSKYFGWKAHYESTENNPYLIDFYEDMKRWAFNLQIYFLNSRYQQILKIQQGENTVIQDRTIYEDAFIFAPNLHEIGLMSTRDFNNYKGLFDTMTSYISPPDLLIYIKAGIPTLVSHIQDRGREYEGNMSLDYLKKLNKRYEDWILSYNEGPLLVINADELDFKNDPEDLGEVIDKVSSQLHGLF
ncbi:deoxynucleoside kinase [Membranihabitans maritimus]|uniref:deoxynucleoside kinase n=1 Tax=Membranihabitans maritimus TaxID=2904244 RepID=UPI001F24ED91|nr:deoxynucleoside kinase [Membranihabitans maritimus]